MNRVTCDACIDGLQADGETPCPCQADDLPQQVRDLKRELSEVKEERDRYRRLLYLEAEDHDRAREAVKMCKIDIERLTGGRLMDGTI